MTALELAHQTYPTQKAKSTFIKLLEAYQQMDYHTINDLLDDDAYYEDMRKPGFIFLQKNIFQEFKSKGDTKLHLSTNICTGCFCNEPVVVFTGNNSGHKYAIYFQFTNGEITDIFRCIGQSDNFDSILPF
jgi:hypothetical protein